MKAILPSAAKSAEIGGDSDSDGEAHDHDDDEEGMDLEDLLAVEGVRARV
jgi:hypothetical protein